MFGWVGCLVPCVSCESKMLQTVNNVHTDFHFRGPTPPSKDSYRAVHPHQSTSVTVQSHYTSNGSGGPSYSQELRNALDQEFKVRNRNCLWKSRSRDHVDERNGHVTIPFSKHEEPEEVLEERKYAEDTYQTVSSSQRQRVWTPHRKREGLWVRTGSDLGAGFQYRDDTFDADEEDVDSESPPKLTPISGRITTAMDHPLVKPIPFKPVLVPANAYFETPPSVNNNKGSSQNSSLDRQTYQVPQQTMHTSCSNTNNNADDGYVSRDWQNLSSSSSVSQNSFHGAETNDRKPEKNSSDVNSLRKRLNSEHASGVEVCPERNSERSYDRNSASSCSRRRGFSFTQTPSPSDSGVGELEAMLREKDIELQILRGTMERNELAMMQVFEEKKQNWQIEMGDVVQEWQLKLRSHQQKAFRTEQSLLLQIFKLQQENKNLRENLERESTGQSLGNVEEDLKTVRAKLEELIWEQKQMTSEMEILKSQLKKAVEEVSGKSMELISTQLLLKDSEIEIECKNAEIHRLLTDLNQLKRDLSEINERKLNIECRLNKFESTTPQSETQSQNNSLTKSEELKVELNIARNELEELRSTLERERDQWLEEKTKVINYQKHLQLNYIQMARKNKMLEIEVQQMSAELERHDAECQQATMGESFC